MKYHHVAFAVLLALFTLTDHVCGAPLSSEAKASFRRGVARLDEHKKEIFNADTLPALNPIRDVQITSNIKDGDATHPSIGYVCVRIRVSKDSGHLKEFWFSFKDGKWLLSRSSRSPWESSHPPKVSIEEPESETIPKKVAAYFDQP